LILPVALAVAAAEAALAATPRQTSVDAAVQLVRDYYAAVSRRDYRRAYALWHGRYDYRRFRRGYAQTVHVSVTPLPPFRAEGAAGSVYAEIRVRVDASLRSGMRQHFVGSYRLRRVNDVPGSTSTQRRWHIVDAHLSKLPAGG
jgi:hypothetical protein